MRRFYQTWDCPECGKKENEEQLCSECGAKAPNRILKFCPKCQKKANSDEKFCQDCGQNLSTIQIHDNYIRFDPSIGHINMISRELFPAKTLDEAKACSLNYQMGNFKDWRLPTLKELGFIYQISKILPDLLANHTIFWSSTEESTEEPSAENKTQPLVADFLFCFLGESQDKEIPNNVILIR